MARPYTPCTRAMGRDRWALLPLRRVNRLFRWMMRVAARAGIQPGVVFRASWGSEDGRGLTDSDSEYPKLVIESVKPDGTVCGKLTDSD